MTQYLLTVHHDYCDGSPGRTTEDQVYKDVDALNKDIEDLIVFAGGLEAPHTATTVANHDGQIVITDGPFAEAKEAVGGFWVIDVPDLDAALQIAARATAACRAPIEVRPFDALSDPSRNQP